jgi:hypothetical protein
MRTVLAMILGGIGHHSQAPRVHLMPQRGVFPAVLMADQELWFLDQDVPGSEETVEDV